MHNTEPTSITLTGHCLCGSVTVTATAVPNVGACHCSRCRRWCSGPFLSVGCDTDVCIDGEEYLRVYDSSQAAERGFCGTCGSAVFYRDKQTGHHELAVGLFETSDDFVFSSQVFIDEKPAYYSFAQKTKTLTSKEVEALYT